MPYLLIVIKSTEYLEKAKFDIGVLYGKSHPLYSITVLDLLEALSMHEKFDQCKENNIKTSKYTSQCTSKKIKQDNADYSHNRFEEIPARNEEPAQTIAG